MTVTFIYHIPTVILCCRVHLKRGAPSLATRVSDCCWLARSSKKKRSSKVSLEPEFNDLRWRCSPPLHKDRLKNYGTARNGVLKAKKKGEMSRVSNFSDLIQRVAASCLLHPLGSTRHHSGKPRPGDESEEYEYEYDSDQPEAEVIDGGGGGFGGWNGSVDEEAEMVMKQVFEAVSCMKSAYMSLQDAHSPWDPERMRAADVAVVAELRRLGVLRERFRRSSGGGGRKSGGLTVGTLREVVAPYEAAVDELKREVKARDAELENLKEKLRTATGTGRKGRSQSKRRVSCCQAQMAANPVPELFEATMSQVREASKSFTSLLLSLMRSAQWDISAAVRSIEAATVSADATLSFSTTTACGVASQHAKFALESYISRKIFLGFDHETFYMDGSLSSLLNPEQFRRDCFMQYRDMKAMDPSELLGVLPTCHFGKFCSKKYLSIVHPKMEESLFGDLDQQHQVLAGGHPRSQFYGDFLVLAKAVWLLHLLAFSLDPAPSQFEASRGAEFHPKYMESVIKMSGGRVPAGQVVGFPVSPGFNLRNGSVVKSRVYLVSSSRT